MSRSTRLAGLVAAAVSSGAGAAGADVSLSITGAADSRFAADCVVTAAGGQESFSLEEATPLQRSFRGDSISCSIRQLSEGGHLQVELRKAGSISRTRTHGKGSVIRVSMS